jgi:hypothetical protein
MPVPFIAEHFLLRFLSAAPDPRAISDGATARRAMPNQDVDVNKWCLALSNKSTWNGSPSLLASLYWQFSTGTLILWNTVAANETLY